MADHTLGPANSLLKTGQLKRFELEGKPVVIGRIDDTYYAVAGNCSHYGAPLDKGVLKGTNLICPWHHACFDIRSGERLEPPALNDLRHYPVRIADGDVVVTLPNDNQTEPPIRTVTSDETIVIIGGGAAGNAAAEELCRLKFTGKIIILSAVPAVPIDRPNLSKDYLDGHAQPEWIPLRDEKWYASRSIDLQLNTSVTRVNPSEHTVTTKDGKSIAYNKLLLATGATPRQLRDTPGTDLSNVFLLRELDDATRIIEATQGAQKAVVIGASFIGMEVAASLAKGRKLSVTVVAPEALPFERILGPEIGRMFQSEHEANGVQFRLRSEVAEIKGKGNKVASVVLKSGEEIPADLVVIGVGVQPTTDYLAESGLKMNDKDHSVEVNEKLQTSHPDIYAAGDIARWQTDDGNSTRIEHWRVAQQHGIVAARNLAGRGDEITAHVLFFWTTQWDVELRYVGHAEKWDEIIYRGRPQDKDFLAFYVAKRQLLAAAGLNRDAEMDALELILRDRLPLSVDQMRVESFDLVDYAKSG